MDYVRQFPFGRGVKADMYCRSRGTRSGFAHDCVIPSLGIKASCHYLNRTWESFTFESVIHEAFEKYVKTTYGVKTMTKVFEREYEKLCKRLKAYHDEGRIRYRRDPDEIFG